jgi:outer membrane protein OmpA-like peptidoglycan-associated protein
VKTTLAVSLLPSLALAGGRSEVGLAAGGHDFSHDVELGVADAANEPGPASGAMIGVRAALPLLDRLAIEAEAMVIPTHDDVLGEPATVYGLRAHVRFDVLTGRLRPFVVAGGGVHVLRSSSPQMDNDVDRSLHWGLGVRYAITDRFDVRVDGRQLIVPDRTPNGATSDYELTAGITYRFGGAKPAAVVVPLLVPAPIVVEAPPPPPPAPPPRVIEELAGIGFELDSAKIDIASAPILERAVKLMTDNPDLSVEISGHTSAEGDSERNYALSLARAEAVKGYLVSRGIAESRILTLGHGAEVPIADNKTEDGRRKNRRIEFRVLTPDQLK